MQTGVWRRKLQIWTEGLQNFTVSADKYFVSACEALISSEDPAQTQAIFHSDPSDFQRCLVVDICL